MTRMTCKFCPLAARRLASISRVIERTVLLRCALSRVSCSASGVWRSRISWPIDAKYRRLITAISSRASAANETKLKIRGRRWTRCCALPKNQNISIKCHRSLFMTCSSWSRWEELTRKNDLAWKGKTFLCELFWNLCRFKSRGLSSSFYSHSDSYRGEFNTIDDKRLLTKKPNYSGNSRSGD